MPIPGLDLYKPLAAISISTLTTFSRCPRKYFYQFGVQLGTDEHLALKFGEAIHAALPFAFFGDLDAANVCFSKVWGDRDTLGDMKRNTLCAANMLLAYSDAHAGSASIYTLIKPPEGSATTTESISEYEIPFIVDLGLRVGNESIPFVGRIDGLVQHRDTGDLFNLEHKTGQEMSSRFFDCFGMNPQVIGYTAASRANGVNVRGTILQGHKVGTLKTNKWDSPNQPIYVTDEMVACFVEWAVQRGSEIIASQERGAWLRDLSGCNAYSQHGTIGYNCPYIRLCQQPDWTIYRDMYVPTTYPTFKMLEELKGDGHELPQITV